MADATADSPADRSPTEPAADPPSESTIVIIGAGFAGICMAIKLLEAGIRDFVILEAGDGVGGVWRDNTYPGCACDVPSHLYQFSFERSSEWSRKYGPQPEILDYAERCADTYGLRPFLRLGVLVTESRYDEESARWALRSARGQAWRARFVVAGVGSLRVPSIPAIDGAESFAGPAFHSSRWQHDVDLRGKRVAVIGTGASAIQFVPQIAREVERLYLFQRTAPWIMPKPDRGFSAAERALFRRVPGLEWLYRKIVYWSKEGPALGFIRYPAILRVVERVAKKHIRAAIEDPQLREKVTPTFAMGCKRILISNDYYPALARDNVEVVTEGVAELREGSIVAEDGSERRIDAVIYGTGFALRDFLAPMDIFGRDGRELSEQWRAGADAYLGTAVHGFPNFFMLTGPNTGLGHSSMIFMIEAHVHYVLGCIRHVLAGDLDTIEVRPEAVRAYNAEIQEKMAKTVWTTGCKSWYLDDTGRNFTLWPDFTWAFWLRTRRVKRRDFSFA